MVSRMRRGQRFTSETRVGAEGTWAVGRVHLNVLHPEAQLAEPGPVAALFHGDLVNETPLQQVVDSDGAQPRSASALVAALYRKFGPSFARHLKGTFCCVVVDSDAGLLILATDRLGSYPLYWTATDDGFSFASELRALRTLHPRSLNADAVNDLFHFGFPLGDKTLADDVRLLPAATTLTYTFATGRVMLESYASWEPAFQSVARNKADFLAKLAHTFLVSMQRAVRGNHRYGLSLSGGLDTRVLLSALDAMGIPLATFTLGEKGCADEVIGEQLARVCHSRHRFVALEDHYLADLLPMSRRMVSLTDGMYTSHGFTEVLALQAFEQSDFTVLLRGHAGELAKASTAWPFHTDAAVFTMRTTEELLGHLAGRFESLNHPSTAQDLFMPKWRAACDPARASESLKQAIDVELSPANLCSYIYLHEFHRRVTVPSLEIFREVVEVRLPLADVDFIECLFQAPPEWRDGVSLHQSLIARGKPEYLKIRNPNTGAPAGAGALQEFILDKLNTIMRRLNLYGYRHYHAFDGWMRRSFLELADRILTEPQSLDRGTLQSSSIRRVLDRAKRGDRAPDHVLQVLLLVELWLREGD